MLNPISRLGTSLIFYLLIFPAGLFAAPIDQQRSVFLQAEQAIKQNRAAEAESLMASLVDYPLYPHLLYRKLARELDNSLAVQDFLARYGETRQAVLLRRQWLERLAAAEAWVEYENYYRETDNPNLQCSHYLALANLDHREEAYAGAEKLWATGDSLPESCDRLFSLWRSSPSFGGEHVWKRYALAMQKRNQPLADYLRSLLPPEMQAQAGFWRQVNANPRLVLSCSVWNPAEPTSGRIFAYGVDRLAADDPLLAQTAWALQKNRFAIDADEAARIDRRTALALAAQRFGHAWAYLLELPRENADEQIRGWRVRAALARQDWTGALAAIELLRPEEKTQSQWRYWRARALDALGDAQGAQDNYRLAAGERDFYGFNAADRIGGEYPLSSQVAPIGESELNRLAGSPSFLAIGELRALKRESDVRSEWFHAVKSLSPHDLVVAAKLAQQWGLDNLAINTAARAGYWNDIPLRFPLGFYPSVLQAAQSQRVDPVMIYSLVRRESAFDPNAGSPAGAIGLMQLMPPTGEAMARRLMENFPSPNALLDPNRNLRYGAAYLREMLVKFGNHFALAAAAYNAGPHRIERWLPPERALPADLWVETIPITETRQYVASVLSHAVIYQVRLSQPLRRISDFMAEVSPGPKADVKQGRSASVPFCE